MKKVLFCVTLLLSVLALGCDKDSDTSPTTITGTWQLYRQSSANTGAGALESKPSYKEVYTFAADSTFSRERKEEGWAATGTYTLRRFGKEAYLELSYAQVGIPTGCSYGKTYIQQINNNLIIENSMSCDGPLLYFKRGPDNE